jgi:hypothetical protein
MAELNVEKKKKSPIGWIILGIVVIALIIWFVASDTDEIQDTAQFGSGAGTDTEYGQEQSQAVAPYDANRAGQKPIQRFRNLSLLLKRDQVMIWTGQTVQEGITKLV